MVGRDEIIGEFELKAEIEDLEEIENYLKYQIEQVRHYENRAERILRIFIASAGISITALSIVGSFSGSNIISLLSNIYTEDRLSSVIESTISSYPISESQALLIILFSLLGGGAVLMLSFLYFLKGIYAVQKALVPSELYVKIPPFKGEQYPDTLEGIVQHNQKVLVRKREGVHETIKIIALSVGLLFISIFVLIGPYVTEDGIVVIGGLATTILAIGSIIYNETSKSDITYFIRPKLIDLVSVLIGTSYVTLSGHSINIYQWFGLIAASVLLTYHIIRQIPRTFNEIIRDGFRSGILGLVLTVIFFASLLGLESQASGFHIAQAAAFAGGAGFIFMAIISIVLGSLKDIVVVSKRIFSNLDVFGKLKQKMELIRDTMKEVRE